MIPKPDFIRIKGKVLRILRQQEGHYFNIDQLTRATNEITSDVLDVVTYLAQKQIIHTYRMGWFVGDICQEDNQAFLGGERDVIQEGVRNLLYEAARRR